MKYNIILMIVFVVAFLSYSIVGTDSRVKEIKEMVPVAMEERGWEIVRYEGYEYGSWGRHGGKVWYHVRDNNVKNTYYRVSISLWDGELQFYYGDPEKLERIDINHQF